MTFVKIVSPTSELANRWLVLVDSDEGTIELVRLGVVIRGRHVLVRLHDDVIMEEYHEYQRVKEMLAVKEKPHTVKPQ